MKELAQEWEARSKGTPDEHEHDRDTVFDFHESGGGDQYRGGPYKQPEGSRVDGGDPESPYRITGRHQGMLGQSNVESPLPNRSQMESRGVGESFDENISDISPIRREADFEEAPMSDTSTAYENTSFLKRLAACAAPIMPSAPKSGETPEPGSMAAHLAFLRGNPGVNSSGAKPSGASKYVPAGLCGRPDIIEEEEEEEDEETEMSSDVGREVQPKERARSRSNPRSSSRGRSDVSSVISEEFGAKTAYLDALAMKTAVSGSKKKVKRNQPSSAASDTSRASEHSEKWQQFLDRKAAKGESPAGSRANSSTNVSTAAEKYASEKLDEMMARSRPSPAEAYHPAEDGTGAFPTFNDRPNMPQYQENSTSYEESPAKESTRAAEDLAAARVEAMMQSLSGTNDTSLQEDEGEI